jgi:Protein of unknown function (DUF3800)
MSDANSAACPTFIAYVDESGDEGFSFQRGSSEWFVISAVVLRASTELGTVKALDEVKALLGKQPMKPLHFRSLEHHQRVAFVERLATERMRCISICVHKPSLRDPESFREKFRLYFYAGRFLLERISWYCREIRHPRDTGDGSVRIVFSNRRNMSYQAFGGYLDVLRAKADDAIDWNIVRREQIEARGHAERRGLQIVDAVASGYWYGLNRNRFGHTEDRYARILHPLAYKRNGRCRSYGLKFFPPEVEVLMKSDPGHAWVRELRI